MKKIITLIVVLFAVTNVGISQENENDFIVFLNYRLRHPATIDDLEFRDMSFGVGDYHFSEDVYDNDEWSVYKLTSEEENYKNIYVCEVDTQKEADKIIQYLASKKGCNSNITYTTAKKYNGYAYYVGIKVTFNDAKARYIEYQNKKLKSLN